MDTAEPPRPSALQAFLRQDPVAGYGFVPATFKRRVPALRPGLVSRSELIGRLRAAEGDVIAVAAPAGYGKSTLLAEWAAADERPVAWLTLDASDDDPGLLVTYLSLALDEIEPVGAAVVADFWGKAPPVPPVALSRFARMLAERRTPLLLVLDDVHELHAPEALDVLAILVASLPAGSSLALVGRSMPPLPFGRMRVKRTVVEVGPPDLALTGTQAATMFSGLGLRLTTAEVATLVERTEGWPAGLYLAALALQGREDDDTAAAIAGFAGDHRLVADYLRDELLVDLDPEVVTFLLGASCLERLSGSLCDAVLERSGSGALLDDLQRGNLLVIPLDDRREWFRLHHLLVDLLQAELDRRHPGAARAIHRRASAWFEAAGHADDAITHAVRAGESARAEALVHGSFARYSSHGRHATIQRWLELFSPEELAVQPLLAVIATWSRWFAGDGDGAARWLARTEELVADRHPPDADGWVPPVALAVLRASLARIPAAEMADEALYAAQRLPVGEWRAMAVLLRGAAEFMLGNEDLAAEAHRPGRGRGGRCPERPSRGARAPGRHPRGARGLGERHGRRQGGPGPDGGARPGAGARPVPRHGREQLGGGTSREAGRGRG